MDKTLSTIYLQVKSETKTLTNSAIAQILVKIIYSKDHRLSFNEIATLYKDFTKRKTVSEDILLEILTKLCSTNEIKLSVKNEYYITDSKRKQIKAACESSRKRVIQLGENPDRVFNFGSLALENIKTIPLLSKEELEKSLDFHFAQKNLLVTFHPVTLEGNSKQQFNELLQALEELENTNIIITCPNSDEGNEEIFDLIKEFEKSHKNVKSYKSLGMLRYLSCLKFVDMAVGNSSIGIYEVPAFHKEVLKRYYVLMMLL